MRRSRLLLDLLLAVVTVLLSAVVVQSQNNPQCGVQQCCLEGSCCAEGSVWTTDQICVPNRTPLVTPCFYLPLDRKCDDCENGAHNVQCVINPVCTEADCCGDGLVLVADMERERFPNGAVPCQCINPQWKQQNQCELAAGSEHGCNSDCTDPRFPTCCLWQETDSTYCTTRQLCLDGGGRLNATVDTLRLVLDRGVLRCGVKDNVIGRSIVNPETGVREGFNADLCRAVAAALFDGDGDRVEFVIVTPTTRFAMLARGQVDVLQSTDTLTMQRDVFEPEIGVGFTFSVPYEYGGLAFAGVPPFVGCADTLTITAECDGMTMCVVGGTTFSVLLEGLTPSGAGIRVIQAPNLSTCYAALAVSEANVLAGDQSDLSEAVVRQLTGYTGPYEVGENVYSKDPLSYVTRDDDPRWSDVVDWTLQALFTAEERNVTQATATNAFAETNVFGPQFANMSNNIVSAVGNYGEIYDRHLGALSSRGALNEINKGDTGLMYSMPLGSFVGIQGPGPVDGGILERIMNRGRLVCAVSSGVPANLLRFFLDFCETVQSAIFGVDASGDVEIRSFRNATEVFQQVLLENVDLLSAFRVDYNLIHDVREPTTGVGLSFTLPILYEVDGRFSEVVTQSNVAWALGTSQNDTQFSSFCYWVVNALIFADESGITQEDAGTRLPVTRMFGAELGGFLRNAVLARGNYGDIYARHLGRTSDPPRSGRNLINRLPAANGQLFPIPGITSNN